MAEHLISLSNQSSGERRPQQNETLSERRPDLLNMMTVY